MTRSTSLIIVIMDKYANEMLMLLERVDQLTDEVHHLRISMNKNMLTIPDTKPYADRESSYNSEDYDDDDVIPYGKRFKH